MLFLISNRLSDELLCVHICMFFFLLIFEIVWVCVQQALAT